MEPKNPLLELIHSNKEDLLDQVKAQIAIGADPNERTEYSQTPILVSANYGRFDVVRFLFESGADPSHLNWTPLFHTVAYGSLQQVKECIEQGADLGARDRWERTPFLLAVQSGDIEKVCHLIEAGADITDLGRSGKSALAYAIQMDNAMMLMFLIEQGFDFEDYNAFGDTALMQAAKCGAINCVQCLLKFGADIYQRDRSQFSKQTAIGHASTLEIAGVLAEAGDDLNQMQRELRASLLGLGEQDKLMVSEQDYLTQKYRVYGASNPQICQIPFWYEMVRCNARSWSARRQFEDKASFKDPPVWCYERFGKSITAVGNGEFLEIAGEHEDSYDPDFCIYNEVFHHKGDDDFTIYQYPKEVFPPTDFHSATLVDGNIYIIGNLGYRQERRYGTTPVYRLEIKTFEIEKQETSGECPGWIYNHSAYLKDQSIIQIQGGEIVEEVDGQEKYQLNNFDFELDLNTLEWTKHEHVPKSGKFPFFPSEYKRFSKSDRTLVAVEYDDKWRLLKVISVHRIDVIEGQNIQFEHETLTVSSDDYLFVVAYSTSQLFDSFNLLEKAVTDKTWSFENECRVSRTTSFPESSRYIGVADLTQEERESFNAWKVLFELGQAKII